jgi:hypothetical protein
MAMNKRKIRLEDGRLLIFFTFEKTTKQSDANDVPKKKSCGRDKCQS